MAAKRRAEGITPTRRQIEVSVLLALGASNKEIAGTLGISERTAEHHVAAILQILGMNRMDLLIAAGPRGLVRRWEMGTGRVLDE
jgi:DNA-binding NarL/FixJ family response regulator